jgi:hypothetical protein
MLKRSSGIPRLPVDFPAKIEFAATMASGRNSRSHGEKSGYPPPPSLCGIITLAGNSPQNPDDKELRGQNLDNKGLTGGGFLWSRPSWPRPSSLISFGQARLDVTLGLCKM